MTISIKPKSTIREFKPIEINKAAIEVHRNAFGIFWFDVLGHNISTGEWEILLSTKDIEEAWSEKKALAEALKTDVLFMGVNQ